MIRTHVVEIKSDFLPGFLSGEGIRVFTTLEGENPGGSIKDHMVEGELLELLNSGQIKKGSLISEVSAGSTALSLAYYGRKHGLRCHLFLPQDASSETIKKLKDLGADLHLFDRKKLYSEHEIFCQKTGSHAFNQLYDKSKSRHYKALGEKIKSQVPPIDLIISAVGTGHSLKGVAQAITNAKVFTAEPLPPFTVNGVRNIEVDRYGDQDPCNIEDFDQRIFVSHEESLLIENKLETLNKPIGIGSSFPLVLSAIKKISRGKKFPIILALGANNRFY